nr:MAG TPA: hypothetical protein [Caudoviricetes sp.]
MFSFLCFLFLDTYIISQIYSLVNTFIKIFIFAYLNI